MARETKVERQAREAQERLIAEQHFKDTLQSELMDLFVKADTCGFTLSVEVLDTGYAPQPEPTFILRDNNDSDNDALLSLSMTYRHSHRLDEAKWMVNRKLEKQEEEAQRQQSIRSLQDKIRTTFTEEERKLFTVSIVQPD